MIPDLVTIFLCILFSAFFSGIEIAFIASNKLRIELEKKQGTFPSHITSIFSRNPVRFKATMLVGNICTLVIYAICLAKMLQPFIRYFSNSMLTILAIQIIVSAFIILITSEFMPKALFRNNANMVLNVFAFPAYFFYIFFAPVTLFSISFSNFLLKTIFKVPYDKTEKNRIFGRLDLSKFLAQGQKDDKDKKETGHDIVLFQNALDFSKVKLRDCMVPRNEMEAIEVNSTIEELRQKFIESGFSKILVFEESIDNVIGYVHSSEMFKNPQDINNQLIKLPIVPETMPANKLLEVFTKEHKSIALVVDEFGGTAGMVTLEDIVEEIFGEIEDEYDNEELVDRQKNMNEYIFSGRLGIDYLNDKYNLAIPEGSDYTTLAGFIFYYHQNIPKANEIIKIGNFMVKIIKATPTRIEIVNFKKLDKA